MKNTICDIKCWAEKVVSWQYCLFRQLAPFITQHQAEKGTSWWKQTILSTSTFFCSRSHTFYQFDLKGMDKPKDKPPNRFTSIRHRERSRMRFTSCCTLLPSLWSKIGTDPTVGICSIASTETGYNQHDTKMKTYFQSFKMVVNPSSWIFPLIIKVQLKWKPNAKMSSSSYFQVFNSNFVSHLSRMLSIDQEEVWNNVASLDKIK